jgi:OmpA-OmpF porin, OOP family
MAMRVIVSALFLFGALSTSTALAQTTPTSEEIVEFFSEAATHLGPARGICVGTEEECAQRAQQARAGLDMLVNFDLDSSDLSPEAQAMLTEFAKALNDNRLRPHSFIVEGHTDALGTADYNVGLSERRASSVVSFLLSHGVESDRITAIGLGKENPRVEDAFDPVNRRVEMRLKVE